MTYLDTSALLKRFVTEKGSSVVDRILAAEPIATSRITYAELLAALARRRRERTLGADNFAVASRQFEIDWPSYLRIDVDDPVLGRVRNLVERYPLRGLDAIHLASVLDLQDQTGQKIAFCSSDQRQLEAARAEGLQIVNPEAAGAFP